jgi:hypothetical protein
MLEQFRHSNMAKNEHRRWIGKLLERAASGEDLNTAQITMMQAALSAAQG